MWLAGASHGVPQPRGSQTAAAACTRLTPSLPLHRCSLPPQAVIHYNGQEYEVQGLITQEQAELVCNALAGRRAIASLTSPPPSLPLGTSSRRPVISPPPAVQQALEQGRSLERLQLRSMEQCRCARLGTLLPMGVPAAPCPPWLHNAELSSPALVCCRRSHVLGVLSDQR